MKNTILKITRKFLIFLFPELYKLKSPVFNFGYVMSFSNNVIRGKNVKFEHTYRLTNVEVGDGTYCNLNSFISNTMIGKFCSIGPNFLCGWGIHPMNGISTSNMFYSSKIYNGRTFSNEEKFEGRKNIIIGNDVFIGSNVIVLDGVTIGDGAVIGAGAVVSKDIPPYAIAVGCPIKVIKYRFEQVQIDSLLRIRWWDFPDEKLQDVEKMFFNINDFIAKYDK